MSTRKDILDRALFDTGGKAAGIEFGPLSAPALMILKRRRNALVVPDSKREQDEAEALAEILFVLACSESDRRAMFRDSDEEWSEKVLEFMSGLPDAALKEFAEDYLAPAMNAVAMAQTESEGPGKSGVARNRATSRSSTKVRQSSGSMISPARSKSKAPQSGASASPRSSNSSSRTRSGKGAGTGGSTGLHRPKKS